LSRLEGDYPDLRINLAHFGGNEILKYPDDPAKEDWTKTIINLIEKYPNVYTDMACYFEKDNMIKYFQILDTRPGLSARVLFGSDYDVMMLAGQPASDLVSMDKYVVQFNECLKQVNPQHVPANIFEIMSCDNPVKFLKG